jgi:hypothetical protein
MGRHRKHDHAEMLRLHGLGLSAARIAEVVGVADGTVRYAIEAAARPKPRKPRKPKERQDGRAKLSTARMLQLRAQGLATVQIAAELGCTVETVGDYIRDALDGRMSPYQSAETDDGAKAAMALSMYGLTPREIARELRIPTEAARGLLSEARRRGLHHGPPRWDRDGIGMTPWLPPGPLVPGMVCTHGPFPDGSPFVCLACSRSAWDWWPTMRTDPLPPDPVTKREESREDGLAGGNGPKKWNAKQKADAKTLVLATGGLSRRERRRLAFAAREADRCRTILAKVAS